MISYQDALTIILENTNILNVEEKPLSNCLGQVNAEDIYAEYDLPMTEISGPDGYAVRSIDISNASHEKPVTLRIIAKVRAGYLPKRMVKPGTTVRIMTGSSIPEGADCVVRFEDTDEPPNKNGPNKNNPSHVKIFVSEKPGENIRSVGSNVTSGTLILPGNSIIGPAQISVLAAIGKSAVKVIRRPMIAIIATGDEIVSLKKTLTPGKSYNCNSPAIAALITHYGGIPSILGIARDNETSIISKLQKGLSADAIITTGGVSMGDYDLVRLIIGKMGNVKFSKIKMGPGASFAFGVINRNNKLTPVFALSGPPTGCINNFEILVRPAILKMMGHAALEHPTIEAIADDPVSSDKFMASLKWTRLEKIYGGYHVALNNKDKLGILANMSITNSFTIIPENTVVKKGDRIKVLPLDWYKDYQLSI